MEASKRDQGLAGAGNHEQERLGKVLIWKKREEQGGAHGELETEQEDGENLQEGGAFAHGPLKFQRAQGGRGGGTEGGMG